MSETTKPPPETLREEVEREMRKALDTGSPDITLSASVTERVCADVAVVLVERHTARVARECAEQMGAALPKIADRCPSCGARSLFIGTGGWITCAVIGCKAPGLEEAIARKVAEERARWGHGPNCNCHDAPNTPHPKRPGFIGREGTELDCRRHDHPYRDPDRCAPLPDAKSRAPHPVDLTRCWHGVALDAPCSNCPEPPDADAGKEGA